MRSPRRLRSVLSVVTAVTTAAVMLVATPQAHAAPAPPNRAPAQPTTAQGRALAQARRSGAPVAVDVATTPTDTLVANPSGTLTLTRTAVPVRKRVGSSWKQLDPTLTRRSDGTVAPAVTTTGLVLSGGGNTPLATMTSGARSLSLSLPVGLPVPTLSGASATYADVLPGVDLIVTADAQGGFKEVLVVKSRAAAANPALAALTFAVHTAGVTVSTDAAGNVTAADRGGHAVFSAPAPMMWDSAMAPSGTSAMTDPHAGARVQVGTGRLIDSSVSGPGVGARLTRIRTTATGKGLALTPDASMLTGAGTVFPVFIDPTWSAVGAPRGGWASVAKNFASTNYWDNTPDPQGYLQVGNSGSMWSHTLLNFPIDTATLRGATISSAQLNTVENLSYSCTASAVDVYAPSTTLSSSNATWNSWAGVDLGAVVASQTVAHGYSSSCPAAGVGFDVTSAVVADVAANKTTQTFLLKGHDESNVQSWKEFVASGLSQPTISITYNHPPQQPTGLTTSPVTACTAATPTIVGDGSVYLYSPLSDVDAGTLGATFELWKTSAPGTILMSSDPNQLTGAPSTTATYIIPESTLKTAAGGAITEFSWHVKVTDFIASSSWSATCNFSFDPTRTGQPAVTGPTSTSVGQLTSFPVSPPVTGTTPSSYLYQLNGGPYGTVVATNGTATVTVTPGRFTNVLTVTSLSAGGNVGDTASIVFNAAPPATMQADQDLNGDGVPDLLAVGNQHALPPGLWQARGTGVNGQVNTVAVDIGANGNNINGDNRPSDFNASQALIGHFTGTTLQDVLVYYTGGNTAGGGVVIDGNGDGSVLPAFSSNVYPVIPGMFTDGYGDDPRQLAGAGNSAGQGLPMPDLIGISGDPTNGYFLTYYLNLGGIGNYLPDSSLAVPTPTGGSDWNNWTITTCQVASGTQMFLWNKSTGALYLWTGLAHTPYGTDLAHTQYTIAASGWNTGADRGLQAADINGDGTADLYTTGPNGSVQSYLVTVSGSTGTAAAQSAQTLNTSSHTWALNDAVTGTVTTAADTVGTTSLTATGDVQWHGGDLFNPDVALNSTGSTGALAASGPVLSTNADFSFSVWVKATAAGGTVLSQDGTHVAGFKLWAEPSDSSWRFGLAQNDVNGTIYDTATAGANSVTLGAWTKLTATYTQSGGAMALFVNDNYAGSGTHAGTWNATGAFQAGDSLNSGTRGGYLVGQLSTIQVWPLALNLGVPPPSSSTNAVNKTILDSGGNPWYFGRGPDNTLRWWQYTGGTFVSTSLGGSLIGEPNAVRISDGEVFVFGRNASNQLQQWYYSGGTWSTRNLGGSLTDDPSVSSVVNNVPFVFGRGSDFTAWEWYFVNSNWYNRSLGGSLVSDPTVGGAPDAVPWLFGRNSSSQLEQWFYTDNWYSRNLAGSLADTPVASKVVHNVPFVFGQGTDGTAWEWYFFNNTWYYRSIGGSLVGMPAVGGAPDAVPYLFGRNSSNAMQQWFYANNTWSSRTLYGSLAGNPVTSTVSANVPFVFGRGTDGTMWQWYFYNNTWSTRTINGTLTNDPTVSGASDAVPWVFGRGNDGTAWEWYYANNIWNPRTIGGALHS